MGKEIPARAGTTAGATTRIHRIKGARIMNTQVKETVINGLLCYKVNGGWKAYTQAELTKKYENVRYYAFTCAKDIKDYTENPSFVDDPLGLLEEDADAILKAIGES